VKDKATEVFRALTNLTQEERDRVLWALAEVEAAAKRLAAIDEDGSEAKPIPKKRRRSTRADVPTPQLQEQL